MTLNKLAIFAAALVFSFSLNSFSLNYFSKDFEEIYFKGKIIYLEQQISRNVDLKWVQTYFRSVLEVYNRRSQFKRDVKFQAMFDCIRTAVMIKRMDLVKYLYPIFLNWGGEPTKKNFTILLEWAIATESDSLDNNSLILPLIKLANDHNITFSDDFLPKLIAEVQSDPFFN